MGLQKERNALNGFLFIKDLLLIAAMERRGCTPPYGKEHLLYHEEDYQDLTLWSDDMIAVAINGIRNKVLIHGKSLGHFGTGDATTCPWCHVFRYDNGIELWAKGCSLCGYGKRWGACGRSGSTYSRMRTDLGMGTDFCETIPLNVWKTIVGAFFHSPVSVSTPAGEEYLRQGDAIHAAVEEVFTQTYTPSFDQRVSRLEGKVERLEETVARITFLEAVKNPNVFNPTMAGMPWENKEDSELTEQFKTCIDSLARLHKRTPDAIKARVSKLKLLGY